MKASDDAEISVQIAISASQSNQRTQYIFTISFPSDFKKKTNKLKLDSSHKSYNMLMFTEEG